MSNTNINIFFIPRDIHIEILVGLPAKSLLRLRWACKYWFDLITRDDDFIKKHYLHNHTTTSSSISNDDDDDRIINNTSFLLYDYSDSPTYTMNLRDMINNRNDEVGTLVNMDGCNISRLVSNFGDYDSIGFGGSCNGLILLILHGKHRIDNKKYFLWNPCTREFKELCEPTNTDVVHVSTFNYVFGFGYDQTKEDYKVMRINIIKSCQLNDNNASAIDTLNMEIGIYTLGSHSWSTKILTDPLVKDHWRKASGLGLLHNEALHWLQHERCLTIVSFDITKEEFRDIEAPNCIPREFFALRVLNGCLCIFMMKNSLGPDSTLDIWIMKDYGVKDSWTKLFSINMEKALNTRSGLHHYFKPINQYLKDGGILILTNRRVIAVCDSKKKNYKTRFIYSIPSYEAGSYVVATYIESLISLNSGKYLTLAESKTTTVTKQDLLKYEVVDKRLVKISQEQNRRKKKKEQIEEHQQINFST